MFLTQIKLYFLLVFFSTTWKESHSARILMVSPPEMYSHYHLVDCLLRELAAKGHNITLISPYTHKTPVPNYRNIQLTSNQNANKPKINYFALGQLPLWKHVIIISNAVPKMTEDALQHSAVQKLLNDSSEKFDLIMFTLFQTEALYGLAHKYDAPVVAFSTFTSSLWSNHLVGNPAPSSYMPDGHTSYSGIMSITERIYNVVFTLWHAAYRKYIHFPKIDNTLHKYFPNAPSIFELMYNRTAMVLVNSHPIISLPAPLVPAMVEIGGFHIKDPKPLPNDLQQLMDNASHGVILFSLGSSVKGNNLNNNTRQHLMNVFSRLQQTVIWKFEDEIIPGVPDNVKIMKWCPQNDIMGHPNLKLFITQGGILSIAEAVFHAVPLIGIPIFADQKMNMAVIVQKEFGLTIPFQKLSEEVLFNSIEEVLQNPKYTNNIQSASEDFRNQPIKPLDSSIYWIEYVLKHKGAKLLRSSAMDLEWYQLYSLDIILIVMFCISLFLYIFYYITYFINKIKLKCDKHKID